MRRMGWVAPVVAVAVVLGLWELTVRSGLISERNIPTMTATVSELFSQLAESRFWSAIWNTLQGWALGLGIAMALAIPLGMIIGSSRWVFRAFRVPIEFLRPIPSVALIPLAVLIYGTGLESKVFLAAFASFWPLSTPSRPTPRGRSGSGAWPGCGTSRCRAPCPTSRPACASPRRCRSSSS
jgi:ABC-type nitrate/sulfonate/bicarbonate transport system permease component